MVLIFAGCSQKRFYIPSIHPVESFVHITKPIGVAPVILPQYLLMDKVLLKSGEYLDFTFAGEPDWQIQKAFVEYLRTALGDERVGLYPWEFATKPKCIVRLVVSQLVWDKKSKILRGRAEIDIANKKKSYTLLRAGSDLRQAMDALWQKIFQKTAQMLARECS